MCASPCAGCPGDLGRAFEAAFGHESPLVRTFSLPDYYAGNERVRPLRFEPERLVWLSGERYALIATERFADARHVDSGDVAVAYLHRSGGAWTSDHLWTEMTRFETFGVSQTSGYDADPVWVDSLSSEPLVAIRTVYCGMGSCLEQLAFFRLARHRPVFIGVVKGGDESDGNVSASPKCTLRARLLPARGKKDLFVLQLDGRAARAVGDVRERRVAERIDYRVAESKIVPAPGQHRSQCQSTTVEVDR